MKNFLKWRSDLATLYGDKETMRFPEDVKFYTILKSMINMIHHDGTKPDEENGEGLFIDVHGGLLLSEPDSKRISLQDGCGNIVFEFKEGDLVDKTLSSFMRYLTFELYCLERENANEFYE